MGPEGLTGADEDLDSQTPAARQVVAVATPNAPSVKDDSLFNGCGFGDEICKEMLDSYRTMIKSPSWLGCTGDYT